MRYFKKILSMLVAAGLVFTSIGNIQPMVYAAGTETVLHTFFTEKVDAVTPEELGPDSAKSRGLDSTGFDAYDSNVSWHAKGTQFGFDSSAGNVHRTVLNNPASPQSSLPGREVVFSGTEFLHHSSWYGRYSESIKDYESTAAITLKFCISKESYIKDAYVYLRSSANGVFSYTGVKVADWFTAEDVGKPVQITIPVKEFVDKGENTYSINGGFDSAGLSGAGIMFVKPTSDEAGWVAYDDFYICDVVSPTELKANNTTDSQTTLTWIASTSNIEKYVIYRDDEYIGETADTQYVDEGLSPGKTYEYKVYAVDSHGAFSNPSNSAEIYTSSVGAPNNIQATSSFADELKCHITWEASSYGEPIGYEIYRNGVKIGETESSVLEYTDRDNLSADTFYTYYVMAKSENDISMKSDEKRVFVTYIGYPESVYVDNSGDDIKISWSTVASAKSYKIYRNGTEIANVEAPECEFSDVDYTYATAYTYYVTSVNEVGTESIPSDSIVIVKNESSKKLNEIYEDKASDMYYISSIGKSTAESSEEQVASGKKSCKVSFMPAAFNDEGVSLTATSPLDLSDGRVNGKRIEFFVYAENADMLENVKVGFECVTDKLDTTTYTARTGLKISDYITRYGYWNYVSIPISDFSATGIYAADIASKRYCKFKFDKVTGVDFYIEEPHYLAQKQIYVDCMSFAEYEQPKITKVSLADGTALTNGDEVSTNIKELNVMFDSDIDISSLDGSVQLVSENINLPVECTYNSTTKTVKASFVSGLKSQTSYSLKFDGVASSGGAKISGLAFDFMTNTDEAEPMPEMADIEYIKCASASVKRTETVPVRIYIESSEAKKAAISGMNITLKYDSSVLSATASDVVPTSSLKAAQINVDNDKGIITMKLEKASENAKTYVLGSYIADIKFTAEKAGGSKISVSGTLVQASPEREIELQQKGESTISVSNSSSISGGGTGGSTGGGTGGSAGGGRNEANISKGGSIGLTDPTDSNRTDNSKFSDLDSVPWAKEAIDKLSEKSIINGYEDGCFRPDDAVTREELAAMIVRAFSKIDENAKSEFNDVKSGDWYYSAVSTAASLGIVNGMGDAFGTGAAVTRQDMCTMLFRTSEICNISLGTKYNTVIFNDDSEIADYARDAIRNLQVAGIVNGIGENTFAPNGTVTRAMAAKAIYELYKLI